MYYKYIYGPINFTHYEFFSINTIIYAIIIVYNILATNLTIWNVFAMLSPGGHTMLINKIQLRSRDLYLNRLKAFQDTELVKIITGVRRCGKSSLMKLMVQHLLNTGVSVAQIIEINFESMDYRSMSSLELYHHVQGRLHAGRRTYIFLDEIQRISQWEDTVNSFRIDFDCDIYITGSNAYLLSSEYATYLAGRYVEINMLPLSFREFIDFHAYEVSQTTNPSGTFRYLIYDSNGNSYDPSELLDAYMRFGGMPGISEVGLDVSTAFTMLDGMYSTIVMRDILERERRREQRKVVNPDLLRRIAMFLADNIGNSTSITSISNKIKAEKLLSEDPRKSNPAVQTIGAYVGALVESFMFYEAKRFDIKGKDYLSTLGKYYIVDIGFRNYLLGIRDVDIGHIIENIVFFELLRRGYDVAIGKIGDNEVDFIATNTNEKCYIQVTQSIDNAATKHREINPFYKIKDNYEKIVITNSSNNLFTQDGIKFVKLTDFLLSS